MTTTARPDLPKTYDFNEVESRLYERWLAAGVFHEEPDPARPPFIISMPPPNITGRAHLGHGSTYTPMDVLTRYHRMLGENADWIPGQDHAAIATESVLVRELAKEGFTRDSLGRDAFLGRAWAWREQYGGEINEAFRRLGFGPDWNRERFTMDPGLSAAVVKVFVDLYDDGLIYRDTRLVNWDPVAQSTLSDAEVEDEETETFLWHIRYRAEDGGAGLVIATTRPETYLADVAVAVHPGDERYAHLIGKNVVLPIVDRAIPVIADEAVEREFGTGAVKVTPAHDQTDYEIGRRHGLPMPTVIDFDARIVAPVWRYDETPERRAPIDAQAAKMAPYAGLDRFEARARIVADLKTTGALVEERPYRTRLPLSSRSHAVIEPLLSLQWFVRMRSLAEPALEAYRSGAIRFVPERFGRTYAAGLENIRDWNISRQIWWGHQLPVWYTPNDNVIVAPDEAAAKHSARERYGTEELRRDPDTLDTWFSSGLWPFSVLGWPAKTPELEHWYPNQVMITSRDIIFLWVSRMVMLGLRFTGEIPFETVFVTPLVFDLKGQKMSKSLGNAIDPMTDLIPKYGADGTRFGILRQMRLESQELRFDERQCDEGKRFANKLWNALRYTHGLPEHIPSVPQPLRTEDLKLADRWILTKLHECIGAVATAYEQFQFGVATDALIQFGWYRFCDWYVEATKAPTQETSRAVVLCYVLNAFARAMHPIAPFITEELWTSVPHDGESIVTASWPDLAEIPTFPQEAAAFDLIVAKVQELRNTRAEWNIAPKQRMQIEVPTELFGAPEMLGLVTTLANATAIPYVGNRSTIFADVIGAIRPVADASTLVDLYSRNVEQMTAEVSRSEAKLSNVAFLQRAPDAVVSAEKAKLESYKRGLEEAKAGLASAKARQVTRLHPSALDSIVEAFHSLREAYKEQGPIKPGEIDFTVVSKIMSIGPYSLILKDESASAYERFRDKWLRPPWTSMWSAEYIEGKLRDVMASAWNDPEHVRDRFTELANVLDEPPPEFDVYIPLSGVQMQTDAISIGSVRLVAVDETLAADLIGNVRRIMENSLSSQESRDGMVAQVDELVSSLIGTTCAVIRSAGDTDMTQEEAERRCLPVIDALQFLAGIFERSDWAIRIDFRPVHSGFRPVLMMSADRSRFHLNRRRFGPMGTFNITPERLVQITEWRLDRLFTVLSKAADARTEIEASILHAVHWFADGELQRNAENKLQSYMTCFDIFFNSRGGEATSFIQNGVAHVMGRDQAQRHYLYKFLGNLYDLRSRALHQGRVPEISDKVGELRYILINFIAEMLNRSEKLRKNTELRRWIQQQTLA